MGDIGTALREGLDESRGLWIPEHAVAAGAPGTNHVRRVRATGLTPISFLRDFVLPNQPVVIQGATDGWRARKRWNTDYLSQGRKGSAHVVLSVTPNGWADALHDVRVLEGGEFAVESHDATGLTCVCGHGDRGTQGEIPDSQAARWFVKPEERVMTLREAIAAVKDSGSNGETAYLSYQNDSLRTQTPELLRDLRPEASGDANSHDEDGGDDDGAKRHTAAPFPFNPWLPPPSGNAEGGEGETGEHSLEAVNLWIGTHHSYSACHKDHYHNFYSVMAGGAKTFTLLPPTDVLYLYEGAYPSGTFERVQEGDTRTPAGCVPGWRVRPDVQYDYAPGGCTVGQARVPWIPVRPDGAPGACTGGRSGACPAFPLASRLSPLTVTLQPGEVLYLPPLWHHQVRAGTGPGEVTVAVNWWTNMSFAGPLWGAYQMARALAPLVQREGGGTGVAGASRAASHASPAPAGLEHEVESSLARRDEASQA